MRLLKGFVFAICGLFVVVTLLSLLMPSNVITSRTITIASTPQIILNEISDLQNWKNWNPLFQQNKNIFIGDSSSGIGAYAEWHNGNNKKSLRLTGININEIRFIVQSSGENDLENKITLINYKDSNHVQVEWSALTKLKWYPWEKFSGIFVDKITGAGYDNALNSLKLFIEK